MKVCILRRSAVAERLSTKAVSDGFFTIGFLPFLRRLFNSLIFLIWFYKNHQKGAGLFIPSYTKKIFFPANSFFQSRRSKNTRCRTICADLFPSGDLLQGVSKAYYFLIAIFCAAGGLLFLCSGGACLINCLNSLVWCCMKIWMTRKPVYESLLWLPTAIPGKFSSG